MQCPRFIQFMYALDNICSYNRRELGVYCAKRILARHLDPLSPEVEYGFLKRSDEHTDILQPTAASCGTVPHPKQYKSISVCLPGGLQYFRSRLVVDPSEEIVPMVTKDNSVGSVFVLKVMPMIISQMQLKWPTLACCI